MSDLYLLAARTPCSAHDLVGQSYLQPDKEIVQHFMQANGFARPTDRLMRGELYAIPGLGDGPRMEPAAVSRMVTQTNFATRKQQSEPAPEEFNANFGWMKGLLTTDTAKAGMETVAGTLEYFQKRAEKIATTFKHYKSTYDLTVKTQGFATNGAAKSARSILDRELQAQLTGVTRSSFLNRPHATTVKDQLNISHKALKNQVKLGNSLTELKRIDVAVSKAQGMANHLRLGGRVAFIVPIMMTGRDIYKEIEAGNTEKAKRMAAEESAGLLGGIAGGIAGGRAGGALGGWAAGAALAAFGIGTGGLGFVAVAIGGVVVGSVAGSKIGEELGKGIWNVTDEKFDLLQKRKAD